MLPGYMYVPCDTPAAADGVNVVVRTVKYAAELKALKRSSFGSSLKPPITMRFAIEKSTWFRRGVNSTFGCTIGTVNDPLLTVGEISPLTTHPCEAELPGHT